MVALANPLSGHHIGELGHVREPAALHRLSNGHPCFRLTQTFDNPDYYWTQHGRPDAIHGACDFGNFNCGDQVLAARAGVARRYVDNAGALAVIINHPKLRDGRTLQSRYWHLNAWTIPSGSVAVKEGQVIGVVGKTGLGAVCHMHFEVWIGGKKVDPWPLLRQNGATEEEDVRLQGTFVRHIINRRCHFIPDVGARFRSGPTLDSVVLRVYPKGTVFLPTVQVDGVAVNGNTTWYGGWLWDDEPKPAGYAFGYAHVSVCSLLEQIEAGLSEADIAQQLASAKHLGQRDAAQGMLGASIEKSKEYLS